MQTGGKFVDEGLYGCIFMPSLECKTKKGQDDIDNNNLSLSKLLLKDNAIIEYIQEFFEHSFHSISQACSTKIFNKI